MIEKIKENIILYVITLIVGAGLIFIGISYLGLVDDVKTLNNDVSNIIVQLSRFETLLEEKIGSDVEEIKADTKIYLRNINNNSSNIDKLTAVIDRLEDIVYEQF